MAPDGEGLRRGLCLGWGCCWLLGLWVRVFTRIAFPLVATSGRSIPEPQTLSQLSSERTEGDGAGGERVPLSLCYQGGKNFPNAQKTVYIFSQEDTLRAEILYWGQKVRRGGVVEGWG